MLKQFDLKHFKLNNFIKAAAIIIFMLISVAITSSCNIIDSSQENLILKPKPSDLETQIKSKMEEIEASDLTLVYSARGKYQNSINYFDLDGDGSNEIIVTYRSALAHRPQDGNSSNICVFKQINGELVLYFDIIGRGTEIDMLDFCDFNNDGFMEIVVGYINTQDNNKKFSIYYLDYINKRYEEPVISRYTDWIITDITNTGIKCLIFVNYESLDSFANARLVKYDVETRKIRAFAGEDTLVYSSEFYRMFEGKTADGRNAVFINAKRGSLLSTTEVLLWDEKEGYIVNESRVEQTDAFIDKLKDGYTSLGSYLAQDIDKDDIIEIPICSEIDEKKINEESQRGQEHLKYRYNWYEYENGLKIDFTSYINEAQSYILKIKDSHFSENIKGYINYKNDLVFYSMEEGVGDPILGVDNRQYLFTIKQTTVESEDKETELKYIKESNTYYIYDINPLLRDNLINLVPTKEDIKEALYFTNILAANDNGN